MTPAQTIRSMTGFGAGTAETDRVSARVEIKCVNNRGLKIAVKSRPGLGALEKNLRDLIAAEIKRGSVDVFVGLTRKVDAAHPPCNAELARSLVAGVRSLAAGLGIDDALTARDLLLIPGLFDDSAYAPAEEGEWPALEQAAAAALRQVAAMRLVEGAATASSVAELAGELATFEAEARRLAPLVVEKARERLRARLEEICPGGVRQADEQSLERELCFFADKADINEELDRLQSHLAQFKGLLEKGGEVGKRLEFLAQEFLREINTSASKANDVGIVSRAVEAKLAVEKIKEQAANLE